MPRNFTGKLYPFRIPSLSTQIGVNRQSIQSIGLTAWWAALESVDTGGIVDLAGGYDATFPAGNAPTWSTNAQFGAHLNFSSASSQSASIDHDPVFTGADTTFSIAFWFRISDASNQGYIIAKGMDSAGDGGWGIRVRTNGKLRVELKNSTGADALRVNGTTAIDDDEWHHCLVIITTDTSTIANNSATIYLDGADDTDTTSQIRTYGASTARLRFGRQDGGAPYWDGDLFDVRFYDRALSDVEAWDMYAPQTRLDLASPIDRRAKVALATAAPGIELDTLTLASSAVSATIPVIKLMDTLTLASSAVHMGNDVSVSLDTLTLVSSAVRVNTDKAVTISLNSLTLASSTPGLTLQDSVITLETLVLVSVAAFPVLAEAEEVATARKTLFLRLVEENTANVMSLDGCDDYIAGANYRPRIPDISSQNNIRSNRNGADLSNIRQENVTESLELNLHNDGDGILWTADQLNQFFHKAHERQRRGRGNRIFIEYRPAGRDDFEDKVRSEILAGSWQFRDEPLSPQLMGKLMPVDIAWTRRHYWESLSEKEAILQNSNGQGTGGVIVANHSDNTPVTDDNYVHLSRLIGTLPTPPRIEIENATASSSRTSTVYVSHNIYSAVSNNEANALQHILEAEDATKGLGATSATVNSDGTTSGGQYQSFVWNGSSEQEIAQWTVSTAVLNTTKNNWFRVLCSFFNDPAGGNTYQVKMRVKIDVTTIYDGDWIVLDLNQRLQEFGTIQLAPGQLPVSGNYPLTLVLVAKHTGTGTHQLDLDFLQLSPLDGWRVLNSPAFGLLQNWTLYDDMMNEQLYQKATGATSGSMANWSARGNPILLDPNVEQMLYFLQRTQTGAANIDRKLRIRVFYRARSLAPYLYDIDNFP